MPLTAFETDIIAPVKLRVVTDVPTWLPSSRTEIPAVDIIPWSLDPSP